MIEGLVGWFFMFAFGVCIALIIAIFRTKKKIKKGPVIISLDGTLGLGFRHYVVIFLYSLAWCVTTVVIAFIGVVLYAHFNRGELTGDVVGPLVLNTVAYALLASFFIVYKFQASSLYKRTKRYYESLSEGQG